tara:strand:- start:8307 stop:11738 length:3432 start_codon:yes stop_codon:yes gene_type:complete
MSKARDISDSAAVINFLDGSTSNIQTQLDNISVTSGSLTKTFAADESATISLGGNVIAPVVSATKEVAQTGATNNKWDAAAASYALENTAYATTLDVVASGSDVSKTYTSANNLSVSAQDTSPVGPFFKSDGTKVYYAGDQNDLVYSHDLSTPYDVSTAGAATTFNVGTNITNLQCLFFKPDGTEMYVSDNSATIAQWTLSTAWDITTASYTTAYGAFSGYGGAHHFWIGTDNNINVGNNYLYFASGSSTAYIWKWRLMTPWNISTAAYVQGKNINPFGIANSTVRGISFKSDGTECYVATATKIYQLSMPAATSHNWNVTTMTLAGTSQTFSGISGLYYTSNFSNLLLLNDTLNRIENYNSGVSSVTLGSGSFVAGDVGKTINVNSGSLFLTATSGTVNTVTQPTSFSQAASGSWTMNAVVYNSDTDVLETSHVQEKYDVSGISGFEKQFYPSASRPAHGIIWNGDGSALYVCDSNEDRVYQYPCSTAYDIGTALTASSTNFYFGSQDSQPHAIAWNADGTRLFMLGNASGRIYQYDAGTAYAVNSLVYNSVYFAVTGQSYTRAGMCFSTDGTRCWIIDQHYVRIYEYELSTPFSINTISYQNNMLGIYSTDSMPYGVAVSPDGTKLFVSGDQNHKIYQWSLSTANSLASATYHGASPSINAFNNTPQGICFNGDGSKIYIGHSGGTIFQCESIAVTGATGYQPCISNNIDSTYWTDINSLTATDTVTNGNVYYAISNDGKTNWSVLDNSSGVRKIVKDNGGTYQVNTNATYGSETWANAATNTEVAALRESMTSASGNGAGFNIGITTKDSGVALYTGSQDTSMRDCVMSSDGSKFFVIGEIGDAVYEYALSTNFDISSSSASYTTSFSVSGQEAGPRGLDFSPDGTRFYICGTSNQAVFQYSMSTAWDISTASYVATGGYAIEGLVFKPDGTSYLMVTPTQVYQYDLSTPWDITSASYVSQPTVSGQDSAMTGIALNADGSKLFLLGDTNDKVYQYSLGTAYTASTLSYDSVSVSVDTQPAGIAFGNSGAKLYVVAYSVRDVYQYTSAPPYYPNQMTSTTLNAIADSSQITLGTSLDFAAIIYYASGNTVPNYSGTAVNYDANVRNDAAILGTDYNYDAPALNKVRVTSTNAANLKIRVV